MDPEEFQWFHFIWKIFFSHQTWYWTIGYIHFTDYITNVFSNHIHRLGGSICYWSAYYSEILFTGLLWEVWQYIKHPCPLSFMRNIFLWEMINIFMRNIFAKSASSRPYHVITQSWISQQIITNWIFYFFILLENRRIDLWKIMGWCILKEYFLTTSLKKTSKRGFCSDAKEESLLVPQK